MPGRVVKIAIFIIRTIVMVYDLLTVIPYFLIQKPWHHWKKARRQWGKCVGNDPAGPYVKQLYRPEYNPNEGLATIDQIFRKVVSTHGDKPLLGTRRVLAEEEELAPEQKVIRKLKLGDYEWLSGQNIERRVALLSRGLLAIGLKPKDKLVIFAETRLEWFLTAQACFRTSIIVTTLYPTLGDDGIRQGINETEAKYLLVSHMLLPKIKKIISKVPCLKTLIYMEWIKPFDRTGFPPSVTLLPFCRLEQLGEFHREGQIIEYPEPKDIAVLMYTSGTTGTPKGVLITHHNLVKALEAFFQSIMPREYENRYIAYLPLSHIFELLGECFALSQGWSVGYASPLTMTDQSAGLTPGTKGDATLLKPTFIAGVPMVMDRICKSIMEAVKSKGSFAEEFFSFALSYKQFWVKKGFGTPILDRILFKKIRSILGGCVINIAVGGAALLPETKNFIHSCFGCHVVYGYGLSETTGVAYIMDEEDESTGSVGSPVSKDTFVKVVDWKEGGYCVTDKPFPRGEIVVGGEIVTPGYFKNEALTREFYVEEDGIRWFYTGDVGEIFPNGTCKIIDRKKDLVKLQHGEYISLGNVETVLKTCQLVDNICVVGGCFKSYTVALVVPNPKQLRQLAEVLDRDKLTFQEMCEDLDILVSFLQEVQKHGVSCGLQKWEIPIKIKLCREDWQPESGLVTPTFKLRRKAIEEFYRRDIADLYSSDANTDIRLTAVRIKCV